MSDDILDYLSDPPDWIPSEYVKAAREWLKSSNREYEEEVGRLFNHGILKPSLTTQRSFWSEAKERVLQYQQESLGVSRQRAQSMLHRFCQEIVSTLAFKGGMLPSEPMREKRARWHKIANHTKKHCDLIRDDDAIARLSLPVLVDIAHEDETLSDLAKERVQITRQIIEGIIGGQLVLIGIKLADILQPLANLLESFDPLGVIDRTTEIDIMPQPGRADAQRILLERSLIRCQPWRADARAGSPR